MDITMEQVEKVRTCTECSYEEAKSALEETGGNVLDAVILIERRNQQKTAGGDYSTRQEAPREEGPPRWRRPTGRDLRRVLKSLLDHFLDISLEVWADDQRTTAIPLLLAVILVIAAPYAVAALLLVGLCVGYRLHVAGRGTEGWGDALNQIIDQIGDTVSDAVRSLRKDKKR